MDDNPTDLQILVTEVENDLLAEIIKNLEQNKITDEQAKKQARDFLALLPIADKKDLLNKLSLLRQSNKETSEVYLRYAKSYEEEDRLKKLKLMSHHIKTGQIEQALAVAKGGTTNV